MVDNAIGQQLHDKATLAMTLSDEEQAVLVEWYRQLDEEESRQLQDTDVPQGLVKLRGEYHRLLTDLAASVRRVQDQAAENERLRSRVLQLEEELRHKRFKQPA